MKEIHKVVKELGGKRLLIANSATSIEEGNAGDVIVNGSHFGQNVGEMALHYKVRALIGNDAGIGFENAGVAGIAFLDKHGVPAAAVSSMTAEIGNGTSTYETGVLSTVNEAARKYGVKEGMSAKDAALLLLEKMK